MHSWSVLGGVSGVFLFSAHEIPSQTSRILPFRHFSSPVKGIIWVWKTRLLCPTQARVGWSNFLHLALKGSSEERLLRAGVFHCRVRLNSIAFSSPCPLFFLPFFEARHPGCQGTKMDGEQTRMENVWVVGGRRRRIVLNDVTSEKT
ncbi:hypothetical protein LSTR_LSTR010286 [Laodelphax striatellus]|uniref:Uncharacterized protein n=1 Tax=Laodelphax striatellus TaxID=195883 RepID=A0A482XQN7_LAOST|nr:hypothetical protein LSTR_LSTR010286 [Laodelphax striatellus]